MAQRMSTTPVKDFKPQDLNDCFNALFTDQYDVETKDGICEASAAFINLAMLFIVKTRWKVVEKYVMFDIPRLESMIRRFHRDVYGVSKFSKFLEGFKKGKKLNEEDVTAILLRIKRLGLRISSDEPRKTKVVAAFALWFSALRPIYFRDVNKIGLENEIINEFCANFCIWVTQKYLEKFGKIEWGDNGEDRATRFTRFKHDFTYRAINMSSFEFMYGSIFRCDAAQSAQKLVKAS